MSARLLPADIFSEMRVSPRWQAAPQTTEDLKRLRGAEFDLGRELARLALKKHYAGASEQKAEDFLVGRMPDRSPFWPFGFVGSISHSDHWVWAAVANRSDFRSIGIDTELIIDPKRARDLQSSIAQAPEWERMSRLQLAENIAFTLLFSAKEAFFKMCYPLTKSMWEFRDVELVGSPSLDTHRKSDSSSLVGTLELRCCLSKIRSDSGLRSDSRNFDPNSPHPVSFQLDASDVFTHCLLPVLS